MVGSAGIHKRRIPVAKNSWDRCSQREETCGSVSRIPWASAILGLPWALQPRNSGILCAHIPDLYFTFLKKRHSEKPPYFRKVQVVCTGDSRFGIRRTPEATRDVSTTDESLQNPDRCSHAGAQTVDRSRLTNSFILADNVECVTSEEERIRQSRSIDSLSTCM